MKLPDMSMWSLEQIAEFIDTHDLGDFEEDLEMVDVQLLSGKISWVEIHDQKSKL